MVIKKVQCHFNLKGLFMDAEKFLQQLNKSNEIPAVTMLVGEESYYVDKVVNDIKKIWFADNADAKVTSLLTEPGVSVLRDMCNEYSFFSDKLLIIIEQSSLFTANKNVSDKNKDKEGYVELFKSIPDFCKVLIKSAKVDKRTKLFKALSVLCAFVECDKIKNYKLKPWLIEAAKKYNCTWEEDALDYVLSYLTMTEEVSLYFLVQELEKISLYVGDNTIWTKKDVAEIFSDVHNLSGFVLIKAMADGDANKALTILREQIAQGEHMLKIVGLIAFQLRRLLSVSNVLSKGGSKEEVVKEAKVPPFLAEELIKQCKNIQEEKIKRAMLSLADINREVHIGGRGLVHLEETIVGFANSEII